MKSTRTISYQQPQIQQHSYQIKCYLKLYQSNGLVSPQSHPPLNYQILDENTLLRKSFIHKKEQYEMYPFTRVFSARIGNQLMSKQVCFADDLQEGINHTTIALVDSQTKRLLVTGSTQQHNIFLQYFLTLFENFSTTYTKSSLFLSLFSTVNLKPNQYIDLLNGQRYTFLSKKDVDSASYKTFYELKIESVQEFLIALKIAMVRFQECCMDEDFVVFRLGVLNEDEFSEKKTTAVGNVIVCHQQNKNTDIFIKQIEALVNSPSSTGQISKVKDHGSLFSCIEPYLRNGKLSFLQCCLNDYDHLETNLQQIKRIPSLFMSKPCTYRINKQQFPIDTFLATRQKSAKQITIQKSELSAITNLSTKELEKFREIFASFKMFVKESIEKLGQFARLYKQVIETREEFYEKERFPVSLEIKKQEDLTFSIKSFYIAKIYSLSEKFQMPSLQGQSQKMMTIKHQIFLSLKSLASMLAKKGPNQQDIIESSNINLNSNQSGSFSNNKSYVLLQNNPQHRNDSIDQGEKSSQKFEKLTKIMRTQLQGIKNNLKYIFAIDSKSLIKQNQNENCKHEKKIKKLNEKEITFILDGVDFSKLFCQQLMTEMQKLIKNLMSKRDTTNSTIVGSNNSNQNTSRENVELLVTSSHTNINSSNQSNSRIIILNQRQKNISYHIGQKPTISPTKKMKRMRKLMSEPQTFEQSLLEVKREQMSKHLQIRQELKKFQDVKENTIPLNRNKVALAQADNCVPSKEETVAKDTKVKTQSEKENVNNTTVAEVSYQKKSKHKQRKKEIRQQYDLVYQNTIKKKKEGQSKNASLNVQLSDVSNTMNSHIPRKISSLLAKSHKIKPYHSPAPGLPQIRRSLQKSLNIDHDHRQPIIHSPKNKRKHLIRVVNNSIVDESDGRNRIGKHQNGEGNRSFLPGIGLMGRRIQV